MRGKWLLLSVSAVLAGVGIGAVSLLHREAGREAPAAAPAPQPQRDLEEISLPAKIRARYVVPVTSPIAGELREFFAEPGQEVYEGQLLARIANQGLQTDYDMAASAGDMAQSRLDKAESTLIAARMETSRARADAHRSRTDLERAEKTYSRQKLLYSEGATPRLVFEKAEKEFESAKMEYAALEALAKQTEERVQALSAEVENARRLLEIKTNELENARVHLQAGEIHSPATGLVVGRKGEPGSMVHPGQGNEIFSIAVNLAELEAVVEAHPDFTKQIRPGQEMMIFLADVPGEGVPGTVKEVSAGDFVVSFISPNPLIRPGMTAQVRMRLE